MSKGHSSSGPGLALLSAYSGGESDDDSHPLIEPLIEATAMESKLITIKDYEHQVVHFNNDLPGVLEPRTYEYAHNNVPIEVFPHTSPNVPLKVCEDTVFDMSSSQDTSLNYVQVAETQPVVIQNQDALCKLPNDAAIKDTVLPWSAFSQSDINMKTPWGDDIADDAIADDDIADDASPMHDNSLDEKPVAKIQPVVVQNQEDSSNSQLSSCSNDAILKETSFPWCTPTDHHANNKTLSDNTKSNAFALDGTLLKYKPEAEGEPVIIRNPDELCVLDSPRRSELANTSNDSSLKEPLYPWSVSSDKDISVQTGVRCSKENESSNKTLPTIGTSPVRQCILESNDEDHSSAHQDEPNLNVSILRPADFTFIDRRCRKNPYLEDFSEDSESDSSSDSTISIDDPSSSETSSDSDEAPITLPAVAEPQKKKPPIPAGNRTKGELGLEDLPKLEDLHITVPQADIHHIGNVHSIVGSQVIVQSFDNEAALDLDSVLFLSTGNALGKVFDVFGKVTSPLYSIRFNSSQDIVDQDIKIGEAVYSAPDHPDVTIFVFMANLIREKGTDASWKDNNEPPVECQEFSDDEQERMFKQKQRAKHKNHNSESSGVQAPTPVRKPRMQGTNALPPKHFLRPQRFEKPSTNRNVQSNSSSYPGFPPNNFWQSGPTNQGGNGPPPFGPNVPSFRPYPPNHFTNQDIPGALQFQPTSSPHMPHPPPYFLESSGPPCMPQPPQFFPPGPSQPHFRPPAPLQPHLYPPGPSQSNFSRPSPFPQTNFNSGPNFGPFEQARSSPPNLRNQGPGFSPSRNCAPTQQPTSSFPSGNSSPQHQFGQVPFMGDYRNQPRQSFPPGSPGFQGFRPPLLGNWRD